jgi:hypothetical protein
MEKMRENGVAKRSRKEEKIEEDRVGRRRRREKME